MDRTELLWKLRDKFEELNKGLDHPWANFAEGDNFRRWTLSGAPGSRRTFEGLAKQAAGLADASGLDGWLDHVYEHSGRSAEVFVWEEGDHEITHYKFDGIVEKSITAIDDLLTAPAIPASVVVAVPPAIPPAQEKPRPATRRSAEHNTALILAWLLKHHGYDHEDGTISVAEPAEQAAIVRDTQVGKGTVSERFAEWFEGNDGYKAKCRNGLVAAKLTSLTDEWPEFFHAADVSNGSIVR